MKSNLPGKITSNQAISPGVETRPYQWKHAISQTWSWKSWRCLMTLRRAQGMATPLCSKTIDKSVFYRQVTLYEGLPFPVSLPNPKTRRALQEAQARYRLETFDSVDVLMEDLEE